MNTENKSTNTNMKISEKIRKAILAVQSALYILLAVLAAASAIGIYRAGAAARETDPLAWIFTAEKSAAQFQKIMPVLGLAVLSTILCLVLRVRDEEGSGPVKGKVTPADPPACARTKKVGRLRTVLIIAAVLLMAAGIYNGSALDVLGKAINICTECVGLG